MRNYILMLFVFAYISVGGQVMLPSFQAIQCKVGGLPAVTTTVVSGIGLESATSGGNVTLAGSGSILAEGICWSTSTGPTIALTTKTTDGTSTGSFTSTLASLSPNVTYYVRAYATNSSGTAYGNEVSFTTNSLAVGSIYRGGTVAYILVSGDPGYSATVTHGMIASPPTVNAAWQSSGSDLLATSTSLGTGASNTDLIVSSRGAGTYAAKICSDYDYNGYTDWYLPSKDELDKLYVNRVAAGFVYASSFWSSSQNSSTTAWTQSFSNGSQATRSPGSVFGVIYFRSF